MEAKDLRENRGVHGKGGKRRRDDVNTLVSKTTKK